MLTSLYLSLTEYHAQSTHDERGHGLQAQGCSLGMGQVVVQRPVQQGAPWPVVAGRWAWRQLPASLCHVHQLKSI
jgi:hypothetical protein